MNKGFGQKNIALATLVIHRKAISLFKELKSNSVQNDDIAVEDGWTNLNKKLNYTI